MSKLFDEYQKEIKHYCDNNGLDFLKVKNMAQCYGKNDIWLQYVNENKGSRGLLDETPAPIVLIIKVENSKVRFEQTEFTQKYLAKTL